MSTTPPPLLKVNHVYKQFELPAETVNVLIDISFEVKTGSFTIIHGPSGSGKSTMLNILMGLEPPTSGTVEMQGQDLYKLTPDDRARFRQLTMGMVYQTNYWINSLSVEENVAFPLFLAGYDHQQAVQMAKISLETVGLEKISAHYPTQLSGGQQQRVSMARALIANPSLIIADEPTGNLDSKNGSLIMDLLNDSVKNMGKTVILVTHNLDYLAYSTQQIQIKDGQVAETANSSAGPTVSAAAPPPPPTSPPAKSATKISVKGAKRG